MTWSTLGPIQSTEETRDRKKGETMKANRISKRKNKSKQESGKEKSGNYRTEKLGIQFGGNGLTHAPTFLFRNHNYIKQFFPENICEILEFVFVFLGKGIICNQCCNLMYNTINIHICISCTKECNSFFKILSFTCILMLMQLHLIMITSTTSDIEKGF